MPLTSKLLQSMKSVDRNIDSEATQKAMADAMLELPQKPGKYDVFCWYQGGELVSVVVAWKSYTKRTVRLACIDGSEALTNAVPLPNGIPANRARYVGTFRVEKSADDG